MSIKKGDVIKVEYTGTLNDGTVFDSTDMAEREPLVFKVGAGQIIPGFDESVVGKEIGDEYDITLEPSEAYGERREGLSRKIPREQFPKDGDPEPGKMVALMGPNNQPIPATITAVDDDAITIDLNHPMAGKTLNFNIKILETGCEMDPQGCAAGSCSSCGQDHNH
ncbi:MAG: FKBP-type peptidyl-prolyl cis-trans isomerase [Promethearchaeia archaeon]